MSSRVMGGRLRYCHQSSSITHGRLVTNMVSEPSVESWLVKPDVRPVTNP